jgi:release factor glutamine methyltransferase
MSEEAKTWTILAVLDWTRKHFESKSIETPRLDAEILIAHALGIQRVMLYARFDQPLSSEERTRIRELVARRGRGEPIAYITGTREFHSLDFEVTPDVLIPRPDTETLVEIAIACAKSMEAPVIADVGTGSGAIAVTIAKHVPAARIYALDRSRAACAVAERNVKKHGVEAQVTLLESDLFGALPADATLDLIAANLPYIPTAAIAGLMRSVRDFEPISALDGGPEGLDLIQRLVLSLPARLRSGGIALLEIGHDQASRVRRLLEAAGLGEVMVHRDLAGLDRVVEARRCAV